MPYARVEIARVGPTSIPDLIQIDNDIGLALSGIAGLRYRGACTPDATGQFMVITVWGTQAQAETDIAGSIPGISERMDALGIVYEQVLVSEVASEYVNIAVTP